MERLRRQIVETAQRAFAEKLFAGTSGNLSVYCREEGVMLITPTSARYETLTPEDIVAMRLDGTLLLGALAPSSEWRMHAVIYAACPEISALVHTHSPYATAFAVVHRSIPAALIETQIFLGGEIRCAEYAAPGTAAVGENALPALHGRGGCLLNNHGVLAVGATLPEALLRAEYIEDAAKIQHLAEQIGQPVLLGGL